MNISSYGKLSKLISPTFVNGKWRKPTLSLRKQAKIKREFLLSGRIWPEPEKQRYQKITLKTKKKKILKGHKHEKEKKLRLKLIQEKLEKMPEMIEDYRKQKKIERLKELKDVDLFRPPKTKKKFILGVSDILQAKKKRERLKKKLLRRLKKKEKFSLLQYGIKEKDFRSLFQFPKNYIPNELAVRHSSKILSPTETTTMITKKSVNKKSKKDNNNNNNTSNISELD